MALGWKLGNAKVQNTHQFRRPADLSPHAAPPPPGDQMSLTPSVPKWRRTLHKSQVNDSATRKIRMRTSCSKEPAAAEKKPRSDDKQTLDSTLNLKEFEGGRGKGEEIVWGIGGIHRTDS